MIKIIQVINELPVCSVGSIELLGFEEVRDEKSWRDFFLYYHCDDVLIEQDITGD